MPNFGQNTVISNQYCYDLQMKRAARDQDLIRYLQNTKGYTEEEAGRLLEEILNYFDESWETFVQRRHKELQNSGHSNNLIYSRIQEELKLRRFVAPGLSERQIRRIIYG